MGHVECKYTIRDISNLGKNLIVGSIDVQLPEGMTTFKKDEQVLYNLAVEKAGEGVYVSTCLGSKNSFYTKDGKAFASFRTQKFE